MPEQPTPPITAIRDAIQSLLPKDDNIIAEIKLHDGVADISICWRSLRWHVCEAIAGRSADEMALQIDQHFRTWLRSTVKNMGSVPKHSRVAADMKRWLNANPDKRDWLYGKEEATSDAG